LAAELMGQGSSGGHQGILQGRQRRSPQRFTDPDGDEGVTEDLPALPYGRGDDRHARYVVAGVDRKPLEPGLRDLRLPFVEGGWIVPAQSTKSLSKLFF